MFQRFIDYIGQFLADMLGMPIDASKYGYKVDVLNGWVHWLMLILFVSWGIFIIYILIKFSRFNNPKADYNGIKGKFSKYLEGGVIIAEVFLLFALAIPGWSDLKAEVPETNSETIEVRVIAQQFAWNIHYPGKDGIFGKTFARLVTIENPIGLDRNEYGLDDIWTTNQLYLPKNKQIKIRLSTKDVIHSFSLPEMRVKQDAVSGMEIPIFFTPTMSSDEFVDKCSKDFLSQGKEYRYGELFTDKNKNGLYDLNEPFVDKGNNLFDDAELFVDCGLDGLCEDDYEWEEADSGEENGKYDIGELFVDKNNNRKWDVAEEFIDMNNNHEYDLGEDFIDLPNGVWDSSRGFEIACAQLCGLGHYTMRGFMSILEQDQFDEWHEEESNKLIPDEEDEFDDEDDEWF